MKYTGKQKRQILERINSLTSTEHEEIFNILQRLNVTNFTSNKNGIFFNLSTLNDSEIEEIDKFVDFSINNKKDLDEYDKKLNECKINTNIINLDLKAIAESKPTEGHSISALPIRDFATIHLEQAVDAKNAQKIVNFIEKITTDRCGKKKINVKFHNAKKKYSKKVLSDSKFECEYSNDLLFEEYLI